MRPLDLRICGWGWAICIAGFYSVFYMTGLSCCSELIAGEVRWKVKVLMQWRICICVVAEQKADWEIQCCGHDCGLEMATMLVVFVVGLKHLTEATLCVNCVTNMAKVMFIVQKRLNRASVQADFLAGWKYSPCHEKSSKFDIFTETLFMVKMESKKCVFLPFPPILAQIEAISIAILLPLLF